MPTQQDELLKDLIDSVVQRPRFVMGARPKQIVSVSFTTPHGFTGTTEMSLEDWADPETRFRKVIQAVMNLEGPFWETGEGMQEGG